MVIFQRVQWAKFELKFSVEVANDKIHQVLFPFVFLFVTEVGKMSYTIGQCQKAWLD